MKQESIKLLQENLDMLVSLNSKLVHEGKFNDAFNVMKNFDCAVKQLASLNIPIIFENTKDGKILDWYNVLKFFIDTKQPQIIKLNNSNKDEQIKHRGTGKTYSLLKLSSDFKLPIITNNSNYNNLIETSDYLGLDTLILNKSSMLCMGQFKNNSIVLVDEGTDIPNIKDKIIIGFSN